MKSRTPNAFWAGWGGTEPHDFEKISICARLRCRVGLPPKRAEQQDSLAKVGLKPISLVKLEKLYGIFTPLKPSTSWLTAGLATAATTLFPRPEFGGSSSAVGGAPAGRRKFVWRKGIPGEEENPPSKQINNR